MKIQIETALIFLFLIFSFSRAWILPFKSQKIERLRITNLFPRAMYKGYFDLPDNPTVAQFDALDYDDYSGSTCMVNVDCANDLDCLQQSVRRQLEEVYPHVPDSERVKLVQLLWSNNDLDLINIRQSLIDLTRLAEDIEFVASRRDPRIGLEDLRDERSYIHRKMKSYCDVASNGRYEKKNDKGGNVLTKAIEALKSLFS